MTEHTVRKVPHTVTLLGFPCLSAFSACDFLLPTLLHCTIFRISSFICPERQLKRPLGSRQAPRRRAKLKWRHRLSTLHIIAEEKEEKGGNGKKETLGGFKKKQMHGLMEQDSP